MCELEKMTEEKNGNENGGSQKGSAIVLALFVLALVGAFVALALTRTSTEAAALGNETAEGRTFYAAQGSLEMMTRNFNKIFETRLNPTTADQDTVRDGNNVPGLATAMGGEFTFVQELDQTSASRTETLSGGPFAGLYALRDNWRLRTTATDTRTNTQVELTRNILNNRVPIFQFGVFYEDDLELFRPPRFSFGGRVHSNRHFFISPGTEGVYFDSRVTAVGHVITQSWRNGNTSDIANNATYIKNASGVNRQLLPTMGSVLNGTPNVFASGDWANPDMPSSRINPTFGTQTAIFDGNLQAGVKPLKLPLKVGDANADLIEMLKRGKSVPFSTYGGDLTSNGTAVIPVTTANQDSDITKAERFANKTGIRISLSDSKAKLPGCATGIGTNAVSTACGIRLDGDIGGQGDIPATRPANANGSRGYQPLAMIGSGSYRTTRVNGERLYTGGTREVWIKIETVSTEETTGNILTKDITADILSLGVTEEYPSDMAAVLGELQDSIGTYSGSRASANNGTATSPSSNMTATGAQSPLTYPDSRSIIKLQRFGIPGGDFTKTPTTPFAAYISNSGGYNFVRRFTNVTLAKIAAGCPDTVVTSTNRCTYSTERPPLSGAGPLSGVNSWENMGHLKFATAGSTAAQNIAIVPFPIALFDSREGEYYDDAGRYTSNRVTRNGVMSMIDIDVANLRRFLRGDFNNRFPTTTPFAVSNGGNGLRNTDIPQKEGWVLYISDRRGDADFDGEYDMEDIYSNSPGNSGGLDLGEDVNQNGILDIKYINPNSDLCVSPAVLCEATKFSEEWYPDVAAVVAQKYYRRGVRLINGTTIPGILDLTTPSNTRGFTVASENGVYVKGNYNATGVTSVPSTGNTPSENYRPLDTAVHIPASIVADSVTILSNNWKDSESFLAPYDKGTYRQATDTTIRFAMISGDTVASKEATPNQGGISPRLNGGVHNFKRFLEKWTGDYLNYSGSLINLYNSRNNAGSFKCCNTVYDPPYRNWVFDSTFLNPTRLPPGTPFFQYVQTTGFERTNH